MFRLQRIAFLFLLGATSFISGCKEDADSFFLGRPSKLAMVNGRILSGGTDEMMELLKVPGRFQNAEKHHVASWQGSMITWWLHAEKREIMKKTFSRMTRDEVQVVKAWLSVRGIHLEGKQDATLVEIVGALDTIQENRISP